MFPVPVGHCLTQLGLDSTVGQESKESYLVAERQNISEVMIAKLS